MNEQAWLRVCLKAHIYVSNPNPPREAVEAAIRGEATFPRPPLPPLGKKEGREAHAECLERLGNLAIHVHNWWEDRKVKGADPQRLAPMIDCLSEAHTVARFLAAHGLKEPRAVAEKPPLWWPEAWRKVPILSQYRSAFSADPHLWWGQLSLSLSERKVFFAPIPAE